MHGCKDSGHFETGKQRAKYHLENSFPLDCAPLISGFETKIIIYQNKVVKLVFSGVAAWVRF